MDKGMTAEILFDVFDNLGICSKVNYHLWEVDRLLKELNKDMRSKIHGREEGS